MWVAVPIYPTADTTMAQHESEAWKVAVKDQLVDRAKRADNIIK